MGNLLISLNIVWVNTVLADRTFLQTRFWLEASGLYALQGPPSLFCMTFRAIQQLACKPSIQRVYGSLERWSLSPSGHQMITNCAHHSSLFQQAQVLVLKITMGLLTFEKEEEFKTNTKGNKIPFLTAHYSSG